MTRRLFRTRPATPALLLAAALTAAACGSGSGKPAAAQAPASTQTSASGAPSSATTPSTAPTADQTSLERVIPEPVTVIRTGDVFTVTGAVMIRTSQGADQIGADLAGYLKQDCGLTLAVSGGPGPAPAPGTILIDLAAAGAADAAVGDEGYQLDVTADSVTLRATSAAGLFHGVQTLRQLLTMKGTATGTEPGTSAAGTPATLPTGHITDFPRYAYRGAMLDVARHFFSVGDVEKYIDAVALYKVNTFHLHLTDDQGWRIAVPGRPRLTGVGGSTQVGGGPGGFYTAADFKAIVAYAAARFMTVIPESDMPGHVGAAVAAYPDLACDGHPHALVTAVAPAFDSLCTSRESVYGYIDNVTGVLAGLTPGPYVGIGGDEASALALPQYTGFVKRAQDIVAAHGKAVLGWAEMANAPLLPNTVAEYWNTAAAQPFAVAAARRGTKLVMAPGNHAYLDQKYDPSTALGLRWAGYVPVSKAYDWDPVTILPGVPPTSVLGVEAPLWTETVHSLRDAETLAFPRLPAIAEIGWSAPRTHDWASFSARLGMQGPLWRTLAIAYYQAPEIPWK